MLNLAAAMTKLWMKGSEGLSESKVGGWKFMLRGHLRCTDVLAPELEVSVYTLESSVWADAAETLT